MWWPLWCRGASVERVRLYVLLYAASAIALASRINYTTPPRRMFLFHSSLPPSLSHRATPSYRAVWHDTSRLILLGGKCRFVLSLLLKFKNHPQH